MISLEKKNLIECDLSPDANFADWGLDDIAYIKRDIVNDEPVWAIYGAEGSRMGYASERDVTLSIIVQNYMTTMSVH